MSRRPGYTTERELLGAGIQLVSSVRALGLLRPCRIVGRHTLVLGLPFYNFRLEELCTRYRILLAQLELEMH